MSSCSPQIIIKRDEDEFARWIRKNRPKTAERLVRLGLDPKIFLSTELGFLTCLGSFDGRQLELDLFQVRFLNARTRFRSMLKSRQVGYSFIIAAEMLARAHLRERHVAVCVSYNLDDAKEKIALVKELHDELPLEYQKKIEVDSKTEVSFRSSRSKHRVSIVKSFPSKAPRGKSGDIYMDEFAHALNDKAIYAGATSVTVRSKGQLTVGSTPLGKRGMFYRIHTEAEEEFGTYWRQEVPWWLCKKFCNDIRAAAAGAPLMDTEERVAQFGTRELCDQFGALPVDDFKQEYELEFQDERVAFFPLDLILQSCRKDKGERDTKTELKVHDSVENLALDDSCGPLFAGFDVGRTKHPSELYVLEQKGDGYALRYEESWRDAQFETQKRALCHLLDTLGPKLRVLRIDRTGIGMNLTEDMVRKYGGRRVEGWHFSNQIKVELANNLKILFENRALDLPKDRSLVGQLGSIKQKISDAGNSMFDVQKNSHHHGDKVWALALAAWRKGRRKYAPAEVGIRVLGERRPEDREDGVRRLDRIPHAPPPDDRDFDSIFEVPDSTFVPRRPEFAPDPTPESTQVLEGTATDPIMRATPTPFLERRARMLMLSLGRFRDLGLTEKVGVFEAEATRIKDELERRVAPES